MLVVTVLDDRNQNLFNVRAVFSKLSFSLPQFDLTAIFLDFSYLRARHLRILFSIELSNAVVQTAFDLVNT